MLFNILKNYGHKGADKQDYEPDKYFKPGYKALKKILQEQKSGQRKKSALNKIQKTKKSKPANVKPIENEIRKPSVQRAENLADLHDLHYEKQPRPLSGKTQGGFSLRKEELARAAVLKEILDRPVSLRR